MTLRARVIAAFTLLLVVVASWAVWLWHHQRAHIISIGSSMPAIQLNSLQGQTVDLSQFRGHPLIVNFFTTWCGPCQTEAPQLQTVSHAFAGQVNVVMVDRGETSEQVRKFAHSYGLTTPLILLDPSDKWAERFLVTGQPETLVIDSSGVVRVHVNHEMTYKELEALFTQALSIMPRAGYQSKSSG